MMRNAQLLFLATLFMVACGAGTQSNGFVSIRERVVQTVDALDACSVDSDCAETFVPDSCDILLYNKAKEAEVGAIINAALADGNFNQAICPAACAQAYLVCVQTSGESSQKLCRAKLASATGQIPAGYEPVCAPFNSALFAP